MLDVRPMTMDDLPDVLAIERAAHSHPWSLGIFEDCLQVGYHCQVFECEDEILAFSVMSFAPGEAHLLNICVHPEAQGKGLGRQVLAHAIQDGRERGADTLFLEVRVSNERAIRLYRNAGFNEVGRRFDYYPADSGREDALVLAKVL